jgi:hypothetical protein
VSLIQYVVIDKYILGILHSTFIGHSKNMARFLIAFAALFAYANAFCFHAPGKVIDTKYYKEKSYVLSKEIRFFFKRNSAPIPAVYTAKSSKLLAQTELF